MIFELVLLKIERLHLLNASYSKPVNFKLSRLYNQTKQYWGVGGRSCLWNLPVQAFHMSSSKNLFILLKRIILKITNVYETGQLFRLHRTKIQTEIICVKDWLLYSILPHPTPKKTPTLSGFQPAFKISDLSLLLSSHYIFSYRQHCLPTPRVGEKNFSSHFLS